MSNVGSGGFECAQVCTPEVCEIESSDEESCRGIRGIGVDGRDWPSDLATRARYRLGVVDVVREGEYPVGVPRCVSPVPTLVLDSEEQDTPVPAPQLQPPPQRRGTERARHVVVPQCRDWTFTSFITPTDPRKPHYDATTMQYLVYQKEQCERTGRIHWQGAVKFTRSTRRGQAQLLLNLSNVHMEPARSWDNAVQYCMKETTRLEGPWEFGKNIKQGHRSDLDVVIKMIEEDKSIKQIADTCPREFIKFHKGIGALRSAKQEPPGIDRKVCLLLGDTGVGKTRFVFDNFKGVYSVFNMCVPWFDGYDGQEVVLFDECGEGMMGYNVLKQLTDRYPYRVPIKGGSVPWMAKVIFLTSNCPLDEWYPNAKPIHIRALERRIRTFHIMPEGQGLDEVRDYLGLERVVAPPIPPSPTISEVHPRVERIGDDLDRWVAAMLD